MRMMAATIIAVSLTIVTFTAQSLIHNAHGVAEATLWLLRTLSAVSWVLAISAWHIRAQQQIASQQHKQLLRKVRDLRIRLRVVEARVSALSDDGAQAAAVVTKIFERTGRENR